MCPRMCYILCRTSKCILALGSVSLQVSVVAKGEARGVDIEDVYYAPKVHVCLLLLGKLEGQGRGIHLKQGGMELTDGSGGVLINIAKVNNVYPVSPMVVPPQSRIAVWAMEVTEDPLRSAPRGYCSQCNGKGEMGEGVAYDLASLAWTPFVQDRHVAGARGGSGIVVTEYPQCYLAWMRALPASRRNLSTCRTRLSPRATIPRTRSHRHCGSNACPLRGWPTLPLRGHR